MIKWKSKRYILYGTVHVVKIISEWKCFSSLELLLLEHFYRQVSASVDSYPILDKKGMDQMASWGQGCFVYCVVVRWYFAA